MLCFRTRVGGTIQPMLTIISSLVVQTAKLRLIRDDQSEADEWLVNLQLPS